MSMHGRGLYLVAYGIPPPSFPIQADHLICIMVLIVQWTLGGGFRSGFLDKVNTHVFAHRSRVRSAMRIEELARIASDGTEDLTKLRWQFSVMIRKVPRPRASFWQRIARVFGIRAVVGHTAVGFLEDDRLQVPAANVLDDAFACIAHST